MTRDRHADEQLVLLDTSACVEILRGSDSKVAKTGRSLLQAQRSAICDPVAMELAQGCRSRKQLDAIAELAKCCSSLALGQDDWLVAGKSRGSDLSKGLTVSPFDYLISAVAVRHDVPLLTIDSDYERIAIRPRLHG